MRRRTSIRVLVAEDDPHVREALAALLDSEPAIEVVATVADGPAAVEAAARERPDVAVIDVRMPGGGAAAARGIRRASPETQVLALSAHDDRATVLDMLEAGAVGYLVKGTSAASVVDSVRQAAEGKSSLSVEVTGEVIQELVRELNERGRKERRLKIREKRIRRALTDSVHSMVFQPIYRLADRVPVGTEALSRFRGPPKRGPELWFAEAEEVGLGRELELAAVRAALVQIPTLPAGTCLSINASPATIAATRLRRLLGEVEADRVVVEVTEHAWIKDYTKLADALSRLRALGVRIAVDDAGAGFASLRHILRLAPDYIKLDRTLINGIDRNRAQQALAVGLISFAERIGATIVAEGIERRRDLAALTALGVRYGQGFFLARPAPLPLGRGSRASTEPAVVH